MVRNNFMMHICTVATLCFPEKTVPRNYYYCVQDDNSLSLCFKSMYRTLFVAIFTSTFIFSMFKSSHTYRNINISNQRMNSEQRQRCFGQTVFIRDGGLSLFESWKNKMNKRQRMRRPLLQSLKNVIQGVPQISC